MVQCTILRHLFNNSSVLFYRICIKCFIKYINSNFNALSVAAKIFLNKT